MILLSASLALALHREAMPGDSGHLEAVAPTSVFLDSIEP